MSLFDFLFFIANNPFDREFYKTQDWRRYQFLEDLGLIKTQFGFSTITPLGCMFLINHA